ncbi:MAG TPA: hypothetical protein VFX70_11760 [Mycobacteriales bacterium]|nr:hypothetical protein [Mycobacteriales bacterium]
MSSGAPVDGYEDRLRRIAEAAAGAPPVGPVVARGRRIRAARRRRKVIGAGAAVLILGAGLAGWRGVLPGRGPAQVIAGGSTLTAAPDGPACRVVGRRAGPRVADGLRLMPDPAAVPDGLRMNFARAAQGTGCPKAAGPLVLVGYGADRRTVQRTFSVWGPGADAFGLGGLTGTESVRGHTADAYGASHGRPVQSLLWTERGQRWLATGHGLPPGELERMVDALRIDAATGTVDLPDRYLAGFHRVPPVTAFAGVRWRPVWTVFYAARGQHTGELSITVTPVTEPLEAMLRPGMRIVAVRGHRAAAVPDPTAPRRITELRWEERPGVLVQIDVTGVTGAGPDLFRVAESLRPVRADDPRVTR